MTALELKSSIDRSKESWEIIDSISQLAQEYELSDVDKKMIERAKQLLMEVFSV